VYKILKHLFNTNKSNFRGTIYFSTDKNFAIQFTKDREGGKPTIYHCKLNIKNHLIRKNKKI
jgi:hypothetical protein